MNGDDRPEFFSPTPKGKIIGSIIPKGKSPENLDWYSAIHDISIPKAHACNCIGPQGGKPLCPCQMSSVSVQDGRYVQIIDHGPVPHEKEDFLLSNNQLDQIVDQVYKKLERKLTPGGPVKRGNYLI